MTVLTSRPQKVGRHEMGIIDHAQEAAEFLAEGAGVVVIQARVDAQAIQDVLALHAPAENGPVRDICGECLELYPCATVTLLTGRNR